MLTALKRLSRGFVKTPALLIIILSSLILAGCINLETEVALYSNEQWQGSVALILGPELVALMESGDQSGFEDLSQQIEEARDAAEQENLNFTFNEERREDGSLVITFQGTGQGYDRLNEMIFNDEAAVTVETVNGQQQVTISQTYTDVEDLAQFGGSISVKITGSEIIDSNADQLEGGTATWQNASEIRVTLTELPGSPPAIPTNTQPPTPDQEVEDSQISTEPGSTGAEQAEPSLAPTENSDGSSASQPGESQSAEEPLSTEQPLSTTEETTDDAAVPQSDEAGPEEQPASAPESPAGAPSAAPGGADSSLPQSGAILPDDTPLSIVALGGLVLIVLTGGAIGNLRPYGEERDRLY